MFLRPVWRVLSVFWVPAQTPFGTPQRELRQVPCSPKAFKRPLARFFDPGHPTAWARAFACAQRRFGRAGGRASATRTQRFVTLPPAAVDEAHQTTEGVSQEQTRPSPFTP